MFLDKRDYDEIEGGFLDIQSDNKQNYFFMLYFQFLYHCFIKSQVKQVPCEIWIDNHDMGGEGKQYEILNKKIYREYTPAGQIPLSPEMKKQLVDTVQLVSLAESKNEPLVQLSDLSAGCVRYILENQIEPPKNKRQMLLFESNEIQDPSNGKDNLANYSYSKLRMIHGYDDINLNKISYHHRFNIFPFMFSRKNSV